MKFNFNPKAIFNGKNTNQMEFTTTLKDNVWKSTIKNCGEDTKIQEIVLINQNNPFKKDTQVYGEGYSMLTQYRGTVETLDKISWFHDATHYKLPQKEGFNTVYNMALFSVSDNEFILIGFSSCKKFGGEIRFNNETIEIALITEGLILCNNQSWELEDLFIKSGSNREELLEEFADKISKNHTMLEYKNPPTGWCSWYCFGPRVTEKNILDNLDSIKARDIDLKFIQIDDGYQKHMGDWLEFDESFPNGIKPLFDKIIEKGFEPAIWVAPFIAQKESTVFKNHPDWFIKDEDGKPLASDTFSFGGWRCAPWYMIDPTNPEAYEHLKNVFSTMRNEWNCKYFKLDANMWGAMHKGVHYDKSASKTESYRLGMKAVLEGAGEDSFLLGCNAPMWPSIGTIHGNRITGDVTRSFDNFTQLADECFYRNWQNNKLWINDPDCVTIEDNSVEVIDGAGNEVVNVESLTNDEFLFNATYAYASGGIILSGDDLSRKYIKRCDILKYLLNSKHVSAKFDDTTFTVGRIDLGDRIMLCLFNREDKALDMKIPMNGTYSVYDVWHDKHMGEFENLIKIKVNAHGGLLLECKK